MQALLPTMSFLHAHDPSKTPENTDPCLVLSKGKVLVVDGGAQAWLPTREQLPAGLSDSPTWLHLGLLDEKPCWALELEEEIGSEAPLSWSEPRPLTTLLPAAQVQALACARELLWWRQRNCFCGCCSSPLEDAPTERARTCPSCKAVFYPIIAPAVIVAITRGDSLLLAHNRHFRPGLHSLIAGFVDPGETLEQCVQREAFEETGVRVGKVRYLTSQPWPYPNSLMLGFTAAWESGELRPDGIEIEGADWYTRDKLPEIPSPGTVARTLIDLWLAGRL